jgi:hypothetical protein
MKSGCDYGVVEVQKEPFENHKCLLFIGRVGIYLISHIKLCWGQWWFYRDVQAFF